MKSIAKNLADRVADTMQAASKLEQQKGGLSTDLGAAITDRLLELYGQRENRRLSFEGWLSQSFPGDGYDCIFETDQTLIELTRAVDQTQGGINGRIKVASIVNARLLDLGHEFGIGNAFVDIALLTGRRLSPQWSGNPPTD